MSLDAGRMLQRLSESLLAGQVFDLPTAYERSNAMGVGILLAQLRHQLEGAAGFLQEENTALRALYSCVAPMLADPALRSRVEAAAQSTTPGLQVGPLRLANESLRRLLIEVQAHAEAVGHIGIEHRIWEELAASVRRREHLEAGTSP